MTVLVVLTVVVIAALIAGLAVYLYWAGTLLDRIGAKLEGAADIVRGSRRPWSRRRPGPPPAPAAPGCSTPSASQGPDPRGLRRRHPRLQQTSCS
jgi:hypothetical protein